MNDDITVVITCFNYGRYVAEAVESALTQEGGPPEVILVDDGSTETETHEALQQLPDGLTLIRQANAGLSSARNTGLARARGRYLIVLDADDRLAPGALAVMRGALEDDPRAGFSYGFARFFGAWEGDLRFPPFDPYKLLYRHIIGSTVLMRREVYETVGGFDPAFTGYEDWDFWLGVIGRGWRGISLDTRTLMYRRHGSTMFTAARANYRTWYRRLRRKHASLYSTAGRGRLAEESELSVVGRAVYRWWWGARPIPATLEARLHRLVFRTSTGP